jgi:hypothetical protein
LICRRRLSVLPALMVLCACHTVPRHPPETAPAPAPALIASAPPEPNEEQKSAGDTGPGSETSITDQPCMPETMPAPPSNHKAKAVSRNAPNPRQDRSPPPAPSAAGVEVKTFDVSAASLLGRKVQGPQGQDLGRVVDLLSDANGRLRLAIIEYGGFLGVGNRRVAVDWNLLQFHPDDPARALSSNLTAAALQATPEYKASPYPQALTAPAQGTK